MAEGNIVGAVLPGFRDRTCSNESNLTGQLHGHYDKSPYGPNAEVPGEKGVEPWVIGRS
jgi:hypothetical protein